LATDYRFELYVIEKKSRCGGCGKEVQPIKLNPTLVASTTRPPLTYSFKADKLQALFDNLIEGWEGVAARPCPATQASLHAAAAFPYQLADQPVLCV
jgi:hypothetical protein